MRRSWSVRAARALVCILLLSVPAGAEELRIGRIDIVAHDVFTPAEADKGAPYRITNSLHMKTRERVLRKFLLFAEGDVFVPSRLEESERNLRALRFIQSASVTAGEPIDGVVNVTIVTQDSWSTEPGGTIGSAGGETDASFGITETNFLGLGTRVSLDYGTGVERNSLGVRYIDPTMFGRYWQTEIAFSSNSDGRETEVDVERPFFAFATPWAVHANLGDRQFQARIYANGVVSSEFSQLHQQSMASYGIALSPNDEQAHRLSFGFDWQLDEFAELEDGLTTTLPEDRDYRYVTVEYEYGQNLFEKRTFVDRDLRYQDFRIGTRFAVRAGLSPSAFGVERTTGLLSTSIYRGFLFGRTMFLGEVSWESRIGADRANAVFGTELKMIHQRVGLVHPQTTVARIDVKRGSDLDADKQFFADGESGLRGYRLYSFAGDSSIVLNLEHRVFLGREVWQFLSPGLALFVDAGNAANGSAAFDLGDLKIDAGVGLRLGITRSPRNSFRLDFAYAFDPDPLGRDGWLISFSGKQAF